MSSISLPRIGLLIALVIPGGSAGAQSILLDHRTATYGNPWVGPRILGSNSDADEGKTLVTTRALPAKGDFEILGPLNVQARWPGATGKATKLLAEQAKSMGGNVVFEARVWQGMSFPAVVAPHGSGIAVNVKNNELLQNLADSSGTWE